VSSLVHHEPPPLDATAARVLTDRIRRRAEDLWADLVEAHDRRAWAALGYSSWRAYATAEFGMSQSRAYQLLDAGRVQAALTEATGSTSVELTEAAARDVKPHLAVVTDKVRNTITRETTTTGAPLPPERTQAIVDQVVTEVRAEHAAVKAANDATRALNEQYQPDGFDPSENRRLIAIVGRVLSVVSEAAELPDPEAVVEGVAVEDLPEFDRIPAAVARLNAIHAAVREVYS
jgi:hypothetical protein